MKRFFALLLAGVLLLACAACGLSANGRYFPMEGRNLSELPCDEIIRHVGEITGVSADEIFVPAANFGIQATGAFDWHGDGTVSLSFPKKRVGGIRYYGCQLRIMPGDSQFFVTDTYKVTPSDSQYKLREYLDALKYLPQERIRRLALVQPDLYSINDVAGGGIPDDGQPCVFYDINGITERRDWRIRLDVLPMIRNELDSSYEGVGSDLIHLFYVAGEACA